MKLWYRIVTLSLALALALLAPMAALAQGEAVEISVYGKQYSAGKQGVKAEDGLIWPIVEEKLGIQFVWNLTTTWGDNIPIRLASGADLEDIFMIGYQNPSTYIKDGMFMALDDLIAEYAPNLQQFYEEFPSSKSYNVYAGDGKQYAFSETEALFRDTGDVGLWIIRQDWLDELSLETPTNLDDLYDVLIAFRDAGLGGGNPVITAYAHTSIEGMFSHAFGLHGMYENYVGLDDDGNVVMECITENYKELMKYLNKLYESDLLDPQFELLTTEIWYERLAEDNVALMAAGGAASPSFSQYLYAGDPDAHVSALPILSAKAGGEAVQFKAPTDMKRYVIPADVPMEKAIKIVQLVDFLVGTEEGRNMQWFGIEGESFTVTDGKVEWTEKILTGDVVTKYSYGMDSQALPIVYMPITESEGATWIDNLWEETKAVSAQCTEGNWFTRGIMTDEITEMTNNIDLNTYIEEMRMKFIRGDADVDAEWDGYVATCRQLGIDTVRDGWQLAYESLK